MYKSFLATHEALFPDYMDELRGISAGSGLPFWMHFLQNLEQVRSFCCAVRLIGDIAPRCVSACESVRAVRCSAHSAFTPSSIAAGRVHSQEFSYFAPNATAGTAKPARQQFVDHCSDYVVHTSTGTVLVGHNEVRQIPPFMLSFAWLFAGSSAV